MSNTVTENVKCIRAGRVPGAAHHKAYKRGRRVVPTPGAPHLPTASDPHGARLPQTIV